MQKKALFCLWVCRHCAVRVFEFISFLLLFLLLLFRCCTRMECLSFHHSSASTSSSSFSSSSSSSLSFHHYFIISWFVMSKKANAAREPINKWLSIWVDERWQICGWGFEFEPHLCFPLRTSNCGMPVAHDLKDQLFKALQSTTSYSSRTFMQRTANSHLNDVTHISDSPATLASWRANKSSSLSLIVSLYLCMFK